jgi:hypothetical protein
MICAVNLVASAKRVLRDLAPDIIARILPKIRELELDSRPSGCKNGVLEWVIIGLFIQRNSQIKNYACGRNPSPA